MVDGVFVSFIEKLAFAGHSLVYWLENFVYSKPDRDPHFGFEGKIVRYFGARGLTIRGVDTRLCPSVWKFSPDWIVLMLGDNDICNQHMYLPGLASLIIAHANMLRRDETVPVIISLLMLQRIGPLISSVRSVVR